MNFNFKTQYWNDVVSTEAFKSFVFEIHGLDFREWESRGFWDTSYTPFSYFDGDSIVASVCIYILDAVIKGKSTRLAQISGVGTHPNWRRKGLNRDLTKIALEWAKGKHEGVFLFSNTDAIPFYMKCGFSPIEEYVETTEVTRYSKCEGAMRLDPSNERDLNKIYEYAKMRAPVSEKFSILNAKLVMFHVLYILRDCIFEIPDLSCLVFCHRADGILSIYDIVGKHIPCFDELYPFLAEETDRLVEFHFYTDKLGLKNKGTRALFGNHPFVGNDFPIKKPVFPFTSRA